MERGKGGSERSGARGEPKNTLVSVAVGAKACGKSVESEAKASKTWRAERRKNWPFDKNVAAKVAFEKKRKGAGASFTNS